jgi:hypothetical protein
VSVAEKALSEKRAAEKLSEAEVKGKIIEVA